MGTKPQIDIDSAFGKRERLALHQLKLLEWIATTGRKRLAIDEIQEEAQPGAVPDKWQLTKGIQHYGWQERCIRKWLEDQGRGTVKVVTGGGKTLLALSIAEAVQHTLEPGLRVAILVPTIVLMHQWYDAILAHGNLPREVIGRVGGGYEEDFEDGRRVLIAVLASAMRQLPRLVKKANVGKRLLLIADE
ncbi:MAG TPA: DEAD/DEAH box helicase family protein [Gemmataceae bacterium]|nr:DEAD/DEAH box helicase family protein [Gemmataceae bacterium]